MFKIHRVLLIFWILLVGYSLSDAGDLSTEYSSGTQRVPVVELTLSEGCSSCPPADPAPQQSLVLDVEMLSMEDHAC